MFLGSGRLRLRHQLLAIAGSLSALAFAGCERGPATAQVSGKVLYKDGSVPSGGVRMVRFEPESDDPAEPRLGASGEIQNDGSFVMYTRKPGDGVRHGKYAVTIAVWKGPMQPESLIPEKYGDPTATPFHVTIERDVDDLFFEVDSR